jgi:hypothetical protein
MAGAFCHDVLGDFKKLAACTHIGRTVVIKGRLSRPAVNIICIARYRAAFRGSADYSCGGGFVTVF